MKKSQPAGLVLLIGIIHPNICFDRLLLDVYIVYTML